MRYAQTGITAFSGVNGCPGHTEKADLNDPHFSVQCGLCEPFLAKDPLWSGVVTEIPLTDREQKDADAAAATFNAVAAQSVAALASVLQAGGLNIAQVATAVAPGAALGALPAAAAVPVGVPASPAAPARKAARARKTTAAPTAP